MSVKIDNRAFPPSHYLAKSNSDRIYHQSFLGVVCYVYLSCPPHIKYQVVHRQTPFFSDFGELTTLKLDYST
ncbi:hypothetical protein [Nostoc sp. PA-18-2419]|uniref:hypothetical protein n=1 Tax=Nostoc sp. PA-18-2419 TaxID=2575443 RepID=UPI00167AEED1|nr:hypothetical protein [Nostoc sp. PA-18-2419]